MQTSFDMVEDRACNYGYMGKCSTYVITERLMSPSVC